jgi:hypothetical protein
MFNHRNNCIGVAEIIVTPKDVNNDTAIFAFDGDFHIGLFLKITSRIEKQLEKDEPCVRIRKKIFNILIEMLQNVIHYFEEQKNETIDRSISIAISKNSSCYTIAVRNKIKNDRMLQLRSLLDRINSLNKEQLVNLYRDRLVFDGTMNGKVGLGFLDIKRRSGSNLYYQFGLLNKEYSSFNLVVRINNIT